MSPTKGTKEILQSNAIYDPSLDPGPKGKHAGKDIIRSNDETEIWKFDSRTPSLLNDVDNC